MDISFDIRTVLMLMAINLMITSAVLLIVQRHYQPQVRGVAAWAGANLVAVAGLVCVLLHDHVPAFLSIPLGTSLFPAAGVLYLKALRQFRGDHFDGRALWLLVGATFIALTYWQLVTDWPAARLVIFSTVVSGLCLACAWTALKPTPRKTGFAERFMGVLFLLQAVFNLLRIPDFFLEPEAALSIFSRMLLGLSEIGMALMSFGFVLMIVDKLISELNVLATRDALTGLTNRRAFIEAAQIEFTRARRQAEPLTLLMLDIDHFKAINDCHGHAAGDEVLKAVSRAVIPCLRDYDRFARFGGEEFVVLLPATSREEAVRVAERLRMAVEANSAWYEGQEIRCTLSVGLAVMSGTHGNLDALLRDADMALYSAKDTGRNRVVCANALTIPDACPPKRPRRRPQAAGQ